jgi:hypothetical protein
VAGEINLSEFLIVEMLRIHRPHVYHRVQENRDLLVGTAQLLPPDERETYERFQRECGEEWSGISRLLQLLFPRLETLGGGTTYVASWQDRWRRDRRICTAEFFDRYFELVVPEHGIPEAEFREIWRDLESPDGLRRHFERIGTTYERTMLLLEKMEAHQGSLAAPQRAPAALALFAAGDLFAMRAPSMLSTTPNMGLLILIRQVVDPLPVDERAAVVTQAIGDGDLGTVAAFVHIQEEAAEKKRPDSLTQDQLGGMKQQVVERIRKEAEKSTLIHSPHFHYLVWPWEKWGGDTEEVARYVREAVADDEKLPLTLELFVSDVFSSAGEYVPRHSFRAVHKAVKEFVDFEQFRKRLQALTPGYRECLTERQREIVGYLCRLRVERLAENLLEEDELDEEG